MKKILFIITIILTSCGSDVNVHSPIVKKIELNPHVNTNLTNYNKYKYIVHINASPDLELYTNEEFKLGDTIKFSRR